MSTNTEGPKKPRLMTAAQLFRDTVQALVRHTPSIVAAAAVELGDEALNIHFDDGTAVSLRSQYNHLSVSEPVERPTVEAFFDVAWLRKLYDMELRPADALLPGAFDARGRREAILSVWRTFQLLAQRAAGLRYVQDLWARFRHDRGILIARPDDGVPSKVGKRHDIPDVAALLEGAGGAREAESAHVATTRVLWDGKAGSNWWQLEGPQDADLRSVLERSGERVGAEIKGFFEGREPTATLYGLMRDYPTRGGKGLRPTLCFASCGAFGGSIDEAARIAAALELFHNAFLIHDDIEDESDFRRGKECLHVAHGIGLAVNAGDGLNLMAIEATLGNIETLGLARTLGLIHEILHMCRETIEGQAIELGWIRHREVPLRDEDYFHMVTKKTGWYTCMSPCRLGAIAAGHTRPRELDLLGDVFHKVGVAFQIQDDLLNLLGKEELYGKEPLGDLLEGKRTLMLIHLMRSVGESERAELLDWLSLPRARKKQADAEAMLARMHEVGSIEHGRLVAAHYAELGARGFEEKLGFLPESDSKAVLRQVAHYVHTREL